MRRLAITGLTVAVAAAAGTLAAGGVGSAASGSVGAARSHGVVKAPVLKLPAAGLKARTAESTSKMYLKIAGVPGEGTDPGWTNQVDLSAYSWGVSGGGTSAKPNLSDLSVEYPYDRSVPLLESLAESGGTIPTVQLAETDSQGREIRKMTLTGTIVAAVSVGAEAGGGAPGVSVSFSFQQLESDYYLYGGSPTTYKSCWSVTQNDPC